MYNKKNIIKNCLRQRIICLIECMDESIFDQHYISFLEKIRKR